MRSVFSCYGDHRHLHSFPTRRSSDLGRTAGSGAAVAVRAVADGHRPRGTDTLRATENDLSPSPLRKSVTRGHRRRSEEHTSELQSPCSSYAVFCLKKNRNTPKNTITF